MSDYLFCLEVPAEKSRFTVSEALEATSAAMHPEPHRDEPVIVSAVEKQMVASGNDVLDASSQKLSDDDWDTLNQIWLRLGDPVFPMSVAEFQPYIEAFNASDLKPTGWNLCLVQRDPRMQWHLKRAAAFHDHRERLKQAVLRREITIRNPVTGEAAEIGWPGDADTWLLSRAQMKTFCDLLAIELVEKLPHFVTEAYPKSVPAALLALPDDARVHYEDNIGTARGHGITSAGMYRAQIQTTIARQTEGYFTLNEAAQVLVDEGLSRDTIEIVRRMRLAHTKGLLPIHSGESRFPLDAGETVRDFWDTVEVSELDAWLRESVGYGFPRGEGADPQKPAAQDSVKQEPAPRPGPRPAMGHTLKARAEPLAAVLAQAKANALDPNDWQSGWAALVVLAQSPDRPAPLLGYSEGEGVKYQKDHAIEPVGWLTRDAYRKRRNRRN